MSTWTKMKADNLVKIEWANSIKTVVECQTLHGKLTVSVKDLRTRLQSRELLRAIRAIYEDMLAFAEGKYEEKKNANQGGT